MTATSATRKSKGAPEDGSEQEAGPPKLISLRSDPGREVKRVPLFEIDGEVYDIPVKIEANDALEVLHIGRVQGQEAQVDFMLGLVLGEEGYAALRAFKGLQEEDLLLIVKACQEVVTGSVKAPKDRQPKR